jgi:hypothetical protein
MIADLGGLRLFPTHNNRRPQSEAGYHAEQHAPILAMQMWRSTISPLARRRHEVPLFAMTTGFSWFPCFLAVGPFVRRLGSTSQLLHVVAVIKSRRHPTGLTVARRRSTAAPAWETVLVPLCQRTGGRISLWDQRSWSGC